MTVSIHPLPAPQWRALPEITSVADAFSHAGIAYGFMGGALRDSLLGRTPCDIDIICDAPPDAVQQMASNAGLLVVQAHHGNIRLQVGYWLFDIICLPSLGVTGESFEAKAAAYLENHIDLTCNALVLLADGHWLSAFNALEDIEQKNMQLAPCAIAQLPAHINRLLRLIRFHAVLGQGDLSEPMLALCRQHAPALAKAAPAVFIEQFFRWLTVPVLSESLMQLRRAGMFPYIFPIQHSEQPALRRLEWIEQNLGLVPDAQLRFCLLMQYADVIPALALRFFASRWHIGEAELRAFEKIQDQYLLLREDMTKEQLISLLPVFGKERLMQLLLLQWAGQEDVQAHYGHYTGLLRAL